MSKISWLESVRGGLAGWALLGFGFLYSVYGILRIKRQRKHKHFDVYDDGSVYVYEHNHNRAIPVRERHPVTPWVMFLIFVLGPCEPMIPLLYFPAAQNSWHGMFILIAVYTVFTLLIMLLMVLLGYFGIGFFKTNKLERYTHALGGLTIFVCGAGMVFMGW